MSARVSVRHLVRSAGSHPSVTIGAALCLLLVLAAVFAPTLSPHDPYDQAIADRLSAPDSTYWLGTDSYGRDVLSRLLYGSRSSLIVAAFSTLAALVVGGAIGMVSGYVGGRIDLLIMQIMDVMLSFPSLLLGLAVVALLGPDLRNLVGAIALTAVAPFARIARAPVMTLKERTYVEAGRALGFSHGRLLFVHILPNMIAELLVMGALWMATAVRTEASLSFIGLGIRPPEASWGSMMRDGFDNILDAPWLCVFPGLAILVLVLGLNLIGDGLRDATDPTLRTE